MEAFFSPAPDMNSLLCGEEGVGAEMRNEEAAGEAPRRREGGLERQLFQRGV